MQVKVHAAQLQLENLGVQQGFRQMGKRHHVHSTQIYGISVLLPSNSLWCHAGQGVRTHPFLLGRKLIGSHELLRVLLLGAL